MLTALPATRQNAGELRRAWYFSSSLDIFAWFGSDAAPCAFEMTYRIKRHQDRVVSWHHERGYRHWQPEVTRLRFGSADLLLQVDSFDRMLVAAQFLAQCKEVPADIVEMVLVRLAAFELPARLRQAAQHRSRRHSDACHEAASD